MIVTRNDIKRLVHERADDKTLRKPQVAVLMVFADRMRPGEWSGRVSLDDLASTTGYTSRSVQYTLNGRASCDWRGLLVGANKSLGILERRQAHVGKTESGENEVPLYRLVVARLVTPHPVDRERIEIRGEQTAVIRGDSGRTNTSTVGVNKHRIGPDSAVDATPFCSPKVEELKGRGTSPSSMSVPHLVVDMTGKRDALWMAYDQQTLAEAIRFAPLDTSTASSTHRQFTLADCEALPAVRVVDPVEPPKPPEPDMGWLDDALERNPEFLEQHDADPLRWMIDDPAVA
jgi:hypothetical protein